MAKIPQAPVSAPESIRGGLTVAATAWFYDLARPRVDAGVILHWEALLDAWIADASMPLFVRKARDNRGQLLRHATGRVLVPADNGPAHWSMTLALESLTPSLADVRGILDRDEIPVAMVLKQVEKAGAHFRRTRAMKDGPNARGWKVAHIDDIGLGYTGPITDVAAATLSAHFKRFLSPGNMFLVPQEYAGVAETPEFVQVFRDRRGPA